MHPLSKVVEKRVRQLKELSEIEWMSWGKESLEALSIGPSIQFDISRAMKSLDANTVIADVLKEATKKRGMFSRPKGPDEFKPIVRKTRADLVELSTFIDRVEKAFENKLQALRDDIEAIQEAGALQYQQTAVTRTKTLIAGEHTAEMLMLNLRASFNEVNVLIQSIDQLQTVTIPTWELAFGSKKDVA